MSPSLTVISAAFLVPLAFIISYYDICYRRIPNPFVLATLVVGFFVNVAFAGMNGALASLGGCALGFFLMFVLHIFGAMGAGDVKLFAAIGAVAGANLVLPMFIVVTLTGGLLGVVSMLRTGQVRTTMLRVFHIVIGLLPGQRVPRFAVPTDRKLTIPYGVAITFGSLISIILFRAW
ncbi:MAG TPA: prepilin peptidase [Pyrinomonadaceae bacterium]|nr:prepilin peptidase [Pyrinomonadaceae bacterium]